MKLIRNLSLRLATAGVVLGSSLTYADLPAEAVMFKNPNCGCCAGHVKHLEEHGIHVKVVNVYSDQMEEAKSRAGVPESVRACHTLAMGGYAVEGHVPIEAIEKLFEERPQVDGIGLAGMPSGSPGMPGPKTQIFHVQAFADGKASSFVDL